MVEDIAVPTLDFCKGVRGELRIVTETLAAYEIAKVVKWQQLWTDSTSRRQTSPAALVIGVDGEDGELLPIVVRAAMIL